SGVGAEPCAACTGVGGAGTVRGEHGGATVSAGGAESTPGGVHGGAGADLHGGAHGGDGIGQCRVCRESVGVGGGERGVRGDHVVVQVRHAGGRPAGGGYVVVERDAGPVRGAGGEDG